MNKFLITNNFENFFNSQSSIDKKELIQILDLNSLHFKDFLIDF